MITHLPYWNNDFDSILTVIERLSKHNCFIIYNETITTDELALLFTQYIVVNYSMLHKLISDHDLRFSSRFW